MIARGNKGEALWWAGFGTTVAGLFTVWMVVMFTGPALVSMLFAGAKSSIRSDTHPVSEIHIDAGRPVDLIVAALNPTKTDADPPR